jgi:RNA polymerase sigma factor (sigma-70 family)
VAARQLIFQRQNPSSFGSTTAQHDNPFGVLANKPLFRSSRSGEAQPPTTIAPDTSERLLQLNDRILQPLITAADEAARAEAIERVLVDVARPLALRAVLRFAIDEWRVGSHDMEDIINDVSIRVLRKLRVVPLFEEEAVERFEEYVEILTQHSIYDHLRKHFPERSRLRSRLRYLLAKQPRLAMWNTAIGTVVGLRAWEGSRDVAPSLDVEISTRMRDQSRPAESIERLLRRIDRPVRLEALVAKLCEIWGINETPALVERDEPANEPVTRFETRESLEILWQEIAGLPPLQRAALLLNLREPGGVNAIMLIILTGVATMDTIAGTLAMSVEELAGIWSDLPLDDLTIAARLGVTRQQVINLRKAARERLARRLARRDLGKRNS